MYPGPIIQRCRHCHQTYVYNPSSGIPDDRCPYCHEYQSPINEIIESGVKTILDILFK